MNKSLAYNTPTQLHRDMNVPVDMGTCMLSRGWMSYKDKETRKVLLRLAWVLPASKAIPRPGDAPRKTDAASQLRLGWMVGEDRCTMNRDIQLFCGPDAEIASFFNKQRPGIGCVNRYSVKDAAAPASIPKKEQLKQDDPEKLASRYGEQFFDKEMQGAGGSGAVAMWTFSGEILKPLRCVCRKGQMKFNFSSKCMKCGGKGFTFDPQRKMGANARLVLIVLQLKGIISLDKGYLEMTCKEIGDLCGLCENTVAEALDEWEDLKVLQVVPGDVIYEEGPNNPATGRPAVKFRYPQRIIWLPGQLLDHTMIERERARFQEQWKATQEIAQLNGWISAGLHLDRIKALHSELLQRWMLSRHSLGAFWNALRTLIYREGIPCGAKTGHQVDYRDHLFPLYRE